LTDKVNLFIFLISDWAICIGKVNKLLSFTENKEVDFLAQK